MNLKLEQIKEISMSRLKELYGDHIPPPILDRYKTEMELIKNNHYEDIYLLAHLIAKKAQEDKEIVLLRGGTIYLLVAYLLGISYVNPITYNIPLDYNTQGNSHFNLCISGEYLNTQALQQYVLEVLSKTSQYFRFSESSNGKKGYCCNILYNKYNIYIISWVPLTILRKLEEVTGVNHNNINIENKQLLKRVKQKQHYNKKDFIHSSTIMNLWLAWYEMNYTTVFNQIMEELK